MEGETGVVGTWFSLKMVLIIYSLPPCSKKHTAALISVYSSLSLRRNSNPFTCDSMCLGSSWK